MPKVAQTGQPRLNAAFSRQEEPIDLLPLLRKIGNGGEATVDDAVIFLRVFVALPPAQRRTWFVQLQQAVGQGTHTPVAPIGEKKVPRAEECIALMLGTGPEPVTDAIGQRIENLQAQLRDVAEKLKQAKTLAARRDLEARRAQLSEQLPPLESLATELQKARSVYVPSESRKTLTPLVAKVMRGEALSSADAVTYLRTYVALDALERRKSLAELERAVAQGSGKSVDQLKPWKSARVEDCVALLLGTGPKGVLQQVESELWDITTRMLANRKELEHASDPAKRKALEDEHKGLVQRRNELQGLRQELKLLPKSSFFQDTGFHAELTCELNVFLGGVTGGVGMHVGQEDLLTHKREKEPFLCASGTMFGGNFRGVLGTKHRGLSKGLKAPGVGYTIGDPFFPRKLELSAYYATLFTASGGTAGISFDLPNPIAPNLYPMLLLGVTGAVQDPRLEPVTDWMDDKIVKVTDKIQTGVKKVKKKLNIPEKKKVTVHRWAGRSEGG